MEKTLNIYDVIVNVKVKNPNDIKVGDIITFISTSTSSKGMTITHRVIEITDGENGKLYKTKGDNNTNPDPKPATFENVIGKVVFKIPQLGRLQSILTTKTGWLLLVVIPAFIIILFDILKLIRLHGAEKSIEEVVKIDNKKKENEEENKKTIEEKLTKKYKVKRRNKNECDPLFKNSVIVEVKSNKKNNSKLKDEDDLVLLKEDNNKIIEDNIITKEELIKEYSDSKIVDKFNSDEHDYSNITLNENDRDESDVTKLQNKKFSEENKTVKFKSDVKENSKKEHSLEKNEISNSKKNNDKKVRSRKKKKKKKN